MTLTQIARALESDSYSPEVFVLLRDEAGNAKGLYRTTMIVPERDENGFTGRAMLMAEEPNLHKSGEPQQETAGQQKERQTKRARGAGNRKHIRRLFP